MTIPTVPGIPTGAPERRAHLSTAEHRRLEGKRARNLTLLAFAAITLSFVSVPSYGAGAGLAIILIAICFVQRRRGYDVKRPLIAGALALLISAISGGSCWWFFLRPAEVSGREERRQDRVEQKFDDAFEQKEAAPPPRDREQKLPSDGAAIVDRDRDAHPALDAGTAFVDDAGSARPR